MYLRETSTGTQNKPESTYMRNGTLAVVMLLGILVTQARATQLPLTDTLSLRAHTYFLSRDLLRGRATGSAGSHVAAQYIVSVCRSLGLEALGEDYLQPIPLVELPADAEGRRVVLDPMDTVVAGRKLNAANVSCLLRGSAAPDWAIAFAAHYDHLGVGTPDSTGDSIYNGFSDNAAGVAMLLAIAQEFTTSPPRHSVLFLFLTGEELGLLGARYLAANPVWPNERILGLINLDAGAPPGRPISWEIVGGDETEPGRVAMRIAASFGWEARASHIRPNSDYYAFHQVGVASVFIIPGRGPYEGMSKDDSERLFHQWNQYHVPGDEWHANFPFSGLQRYADYALRVARGLDELQSHNSPTGPGGME